MKMSFKREVGKKGKKKETNARPCQERTGKLGSAELRKMREEQLDLVTMRHRVPGFEMRQSSQAKQTEHGVLPNCSGAVGHGGGLQEGRFCLPC